MKLPVIALAIALAWSVQGAAVAELLLIAKDIRKRKLAQGLIYREGRFLPSNEPRE